MSNLAQEKHGQKELVFDILYGVLSGVLYATYALAFLFLAPLQYAYAHKGKKSGLVATIASLVIVVLAALFGLNDFSALNPGLLAASVLPLVLLMVALWFINSGLGRLSEGQKLVAASAVLAAISWPFLNKMLLNHDVVTGLESIVQESLNSVAGQQIDASLVHATLDFAMRVIKSAYAPILLGFLALNWSIGNAFARLKAIRSASLDPNALQRHGAINVYVPFSLLWPTLLTWTGLFLIVALKKDGPVASIVWNMALFLAALYAVQGLGILDFFLRRLRSGGLIRLLLPLLVVFCFLNQTVATVVLIVLPLLGITEVWFPYRNFKGVRL